MFSSTVRFVAFLLAYNVRLRRARYFEVLKTNSNEESNSNFVVTSFTTESDDSVGKLQNKFHQLHCAWLMGTISEIKRRRKISETDESAFGQKFNRVELLQ